VPTELLVYPGEPHGLTKYKHRKAKMEWDLAWFERYVRGQANPKSETGKQRDRLFRDEGIETTVDQVSAIEKLLGVHDLSPFTPK
jgi:hypothetical protein